MRLERSHWVLLALLAASGCGKDAPPASVAGASTPGTQPQNQLSQLPKPPAAPLPVVEVAGVAVMIRTPENQKGTFQSEPDFNRRVPAKVFPLADFKRTIEKTNLTLDARVEAKAAGAGKVTLEVFQAGKRVGREEKSGDGKSAVELSVEFRSPKLSAVDKQAGFKDIQGEAVITTSDGKEAHLPFSYSNFDSSGPSYVQARQGSDCVIYNSPERASGCYQNRTRSTQSITFNDGVSHHHQVDVQLSGGLQINVSIVQIQLGVNTTISNGTDTQHGSQIQFTTCIECASVIYRQVVETIRKADVYHVLADGSIAWAGDSTVTDKEVAYEFASTGSESQNYGCDIPSQLPVGASPACGPMLGGGLGR